MIANRNSTIVSQSDTICHKNSSADLGQLLPPELASRLAAIYQMALDAYREHEAAQQRAGGEHGNNAVNP